MASSEQSEMNLHEDNIRTAPSDVASGSSSAHQDIPSNDQDGADVLVLNPWTMHLVSDHVQTIRRTMLEQDAEFREQVRELHRVFNVQKELVQQLRSNEQCRNPLSLNVGSSSQIDTGSRIALNECQSSQSKNLKIQSKPILIDLNEPAEDNSIVEEVRNPSLINFIDSMNLNDEIREHSGNRTSSDLLLKLKKEWWHINSGVGRSGRGRDTNRSLAPSVQSMMRSFENKRGESWFGVNRLYRSEVFGRGHPHHLPAPSPSCTFTGFPNTNLQTRSSNSVIDTDVQPHKGIWPSCIYKAPHINLKKFGDNSATDTDVQPHKGKTIGGDIEWRHEEEASRNASWPRLMSSFIESQDEHYAMSYPPMIDNGGKVAPKFQVKQGSETGFSMSMLRHSASEAGHKAIQLVDMPDVKKTRNFLGFPSRNQEQRCSGFYESQNLPLNTFSKPKLGDICYSSGLSSIIIEHGLKRRMDDIPSGSGSGKNPKFYRNQFHPKSGLNLGVSESSDVPPINNVMNSSALPVLRASIPHQGEVNCDPWSMSTKLDHSGKLVRMPPSKIARAQEKEYQCFNTKPVRAAATNILLLSSNAHDRCLKDNASHPVTDHSCQTLFWFADIVSSVAKDGALPTEDDAPDSFESMTLKLEEIKEEEYSKWSGPIEAGVPIEEKTNVAEQLLTKARRGQGKKRRQPRDFQKEVLPSLSSLTRNEVTEDLQVLGALMRTAGIPMPMGISRRNAGRLGRGRGRPPRNAAVEVVENPDSQPRMPPPSEANILAGIGWGIRQQRRPKKN